MPRKPKISRDAVLSAALSLVDQDGVDALSMRRLGKALDVEAMSLYRYVPNKEAVLNGVYEAVLQEVEFPEKSGDWLHDVKALGCAMRETLQRHPKALPIFVSRPALTEGSMRYFEHGMDILAECFPTAALRLVAFQSLFAYIVGQTLYQYEQELREKRPLESEALERDSYPMLFETKESGEELIGEDAFRFGLDAFLVGLQQKSVCSLSH